MFTNNDFGKYAEKVFNYLDTLDIQPYLTEFRGEKLYLLMEKLEEVYPYKDEYSESLFDGIDEYEFSEYLNSKYPNMNVYETCIRYYTIANK